MICCEPAPSRAELRRRKLTDTARKLFIANGFHATGMAQIARESGIAIGQIYRDFASKEDIVAALVRADCGRLMRYGEIDAAVRLGDAAAARRWIGDFVQPAPDPDDTRLFAEIIAESGRSARIAAVFATQQAELRGHLLAALALLLPGDTMTRRRELIADALITLSLGLKHYRLLQPDLDTTDLTRALHVLIDRELGVATV